MDSRIILGAHGGVGADIHGDLLKNYVHEGFEILKNGGSSMDAVIKVVTLLEDDPNFNAGTGSNMKLDGSIEMDAAIADSTGKYGAVSAIQYVKNPVLVARKVAETTAHVLLVGEGATLFARSSGFEYYDPSTDKARKKLEASLKAIDENKKYEYLKKFMGTVGAVALDKYGVYSAATSTGGVSYMLKGRVGDTSLFGCGIYAAKNGALVATGIGEEIIKKVLTKTVYDDSLNGKDPALALKERIGEYSSDIAVGVLFLYRGVFYSYSNQSMSSTYEEGYVG